MRRAGRARTRDRVLAAPVIAGIDVPPHRASAMDGYAVVAADLPLEGEAMLEVVGVSSAGRSHGATVGRGQCVRILTGAVVPDATDTIIMQEDVRLADPQGSRIVIGAGHRAGQCVRPARRACARARGGSSSSAVYSLAVLTVSDSRDESMDSSGRLPDKVLDGFGETFRAVSYAEIGTSALQSRALAGVANATCVFCVPRVRPEPARLPGTR